MLRATIGDVMYCVISGVLVTLAICSGGTAHTGSEVWRHGAQHTQAVRYGGMGRSTHRQ